MELIDSVDVIWWDFQSRMSVSLPFQMKAPKQLVITILTCQKMMVLMSMELIGFVDVIR
jgi:hypothetical protein